MLCLKDFEEHAEKNMERKIWAFYSQGAEREFTLRENLRSFTRFTLLPRMLSCTPERDLSVTVLGDKLSMPIGISPMSCQRLAHPDGEVAAASAAAEAGVVYTLSTMSNTSIKDLAECRSKKFPLWMQLYVFKDRSFAEDIIRKAQANGYKALVITVDRPVLGLQLKSWKNRLMLPPHLKFPNVFDSTKVGQFTPQAVTSDLRKNIEFIDGTLTWDDITWIKHLTNLPIVLKGILTAEDALKAVEYGASAVWVSNHGGRQLDGGPSALDVLPEISSALAGTGCEIYVDGGVRWGSDVLKALALGARAVFIGRPVLWGLYHSGEDGVSSVLEILKAELDRAMHLTGCNKISDIGPHLIKKRHSAKM